MLELTKLPTRKGILPTTPFDGLATLVNERFFFALISCALACASVALLDNKEFSAICRSYEPIILFLANSRLFSAVSLAVATFACATLTVA